MNRIRKTLSVVGPAIAIRARRLSGVGVRLFSVIAMAVAAGLFFPAVAAAQTSSGMGAGCSMGGGMAIGMGLAALLVAATIGALVALTVYLVRRSRPHGPQEA